VIVVAVEDFDVDARVGHPPRELSELTGPALVQTLDDDLTFVKNLDARGLESPARGGAVLEEEVGDTETVDDEGASSLDAHARTPKGIAHGGQGTWAIVECNRQILHALLMRTDRCVERMGRLMSCQLSRPHDRHLHSLGLSDSPDLSLLLRVQLPHETHVAALKDQGSAALCGEAGSGATVLLCSAVLEGGRGEHGSEATEGAVERFQRVAGGNDLFGDASLAKSQHDGLLSYVCD